MNLAPGSSAKQIRCAPFLLFCAGIAVVAVSSICARFLLEHGLTWRCPAIVLFNLPCPGCGGTRALSALAELRFLDAFRLNPLLVVGAAIAPIFLFPGVRQKEWRKGAWVTLGIVVALNWIYLAMFLPR